MRLKPTHLKAAAALLLEGADTPEDLAKAVVGLVDELRAADTSHMIVSQFDGQQPFYMGYGPYPTRNAAKKVLEAGQVTPGIPAVSVIVPCYSPEHLQSKWFDVDEFDPKEHATKFITTKTGRR